MAPHVNSTYMSVKAFIYVRIDIIYLFTYFYFFFFLHDKLIRDNILISINYKMLHIICKVYCITLKRRNILNVIKVTDMRQQY